MIEASAEQISEGNSEEWYYATGDSNKEQLGPFSFEKVTALTFVAPELLAIPAELGLYLDRLAVWQHEENR